MKVVKKGVDSMLVTVIEGVARKGRVL